MKEITARLKAAEDKDQPTTPEELRRMEEKLEKENAQIKSEIERQQKEKEILKSKIQKLEAEVKRLQSDDRLPDDEKRRRIDALKKQISAQLNLMLAQ
jgi:predicted RNase H-like nuclease (RuvC/YqgF family)